jgi:tRNA-Thr(GGU) m(6)t(6)A37 methyltransferase TsaA
MKIIYQPIGIIYSPFVELSGMPIQPRAAKGARGKVEVFPEYEAALKDLEGFSHIYLIYHFHRNQDYQFVVTPYLDSKARGLFSTRAPKRPNPIGISVVNLISVEANIIEIENVDVLNGTPLLDIKPFIPDFNAQGEIRIGWVEQARNDISKKNSDGRFSDD